jgi:RNA polymerase sigma factor (sigma-70 family)
MAPAGEPPTPERPVDPDARAAAGGDHEAFARLHHRLAPGLRALLARRGCAPALIDDLCQRAWAGAWEACVQGRYAPTRSAFSTFVYAVTHHVWVEHLRRVGRRDEFVDFEQAAPERREPPALAEEVQAVRDALAGRGPVGSQLSDQERWVLRLVSQGQTDREIARRLGVSPSTAHETRKAAVEKLGRILGRAGLRDESTERRAPNAEAPSDGRALRGVPRREHRADTP